VRHVHAVTNDEQVRHDEADMLGFQRLGKLAGFFEKHRDGYPFGAALGHEILGEGDRAAGFENIVDDEHIAAGHGAFHVPDELHLACRCCPGPVARQRDELDFRRQSRAMQRPNQVGGKDETALEDRDHQQVAVAGGGNLGR
jgi:hypothetical protein